MSGRISTRVMPHVPPTLLASHPCRGCRYDLRGLRADGSCPECARKISASVRVCPRCLISKRHFVLLTPPSGEHAGVGWCSRCGGLGFEQGALRDTVRARLHGRLRTVKPGHDHAPAELLGDAPVDCQFCTQPMRAMRLGRSVTIDRCETCRWIWLDRGELPPLVRYLRLHLGDEKVPRNVEGSLENPRKQRSWSRFSADEDSVLRIVLESLPYFFWW